MSAEPPDLLIVRGRDAGLFGEILVSDADGTRTMWCGTLCHGSAFLEPPLTVGSARLSPGPVPEAGYALGWLVAAYLRPTGTLLMVGLGPGVGVVALLHNFPQLRVVAIEIDPVVIRLARAHFPLIDHFLAQGRLEIVNADVSAFVAERPDQRWSSVLLDAFETDTNLVRPRRLLASLVGRTESLWLNILDSIGGTRMRSMLRILRQTGWTTGVALPVANVEKQGEYQSGNILIGTEAIPRDALLKFKPFTGNHHANSLRARRVYASMVRNLIALTREHEG